MVGAIYSALVFLITVLFDSYLIILMLRLMLFWTGANSFNPITQFILTITNIVVNPVRRFIPNFRRLETSTLVVIFLFEVIKYFLLGFVTLGIPYNIFGILILACADILKLVLNTFFYVILLQAILSWIQQGYSPVSLLLTQLAAPVLQPFRRVIPLVGGIDISAIPALIVLQLLIILLANPLINLGIRISFG